MAKGYGLVKQAVADSEARRAQAGNFAFELRGKDIREAGGEVIVRFLEQGNEGPDAVNVYPRHEYKVPDSRAKSGYFTNHFTCLKETDPNADCPGCKAGLEIKPQTVYNLIQRNRPAFRKGSDNKPLQDATGNRIVDGHADEVVYWKCASTTGNMMSRKDNDYHGLMSRDFKLQWTGASYQPYEVVPVDVDGGPQPMSDNDRALAAQKHNLDDIYKPPPFQEAASIVAKYGANSGAGSSQGSIPSAVPNTAQANPMLAGATLPAGQSPFAAAQQPAPTQQ
jgi:hypothetical protein